MPFKETKPAPILTPLDKALDDIQNGKKEEVPINLSPVTPAEAATAPQPLPEPVVPPVPESRVVEVQPDTSFFGLSIGMYDPFTHGEQAASFNVEWQPGVRIGGVLQPLFGAMATTNGALLGYGGIGVPFNITDRVFMMPSVAVGGYKSGGGVDLDSGIAFRLGTEIAYQFDNKSRLGLNFHVLSNGSMSRDDRTEIIGLVYTQPFNWKPAPAGGPSVHAEETPAAEAEPQESIVIP